jgi:molybdenum cofactor cytidylyltransferase
MNNIAILLLAAGGSSRMGQAKQLLPWGDTTLIEHQIRTLIKTGNRVNVVLGFDSDLIIPVIEKYQINIFINSNWESGMGNSLSFGIGETERKFPEAEGVLIALLDQPLITSSYYEKMLSAFQPGSQQIIVSKSSSGWRGVPVIFDKSYFKDLSKLKNDEGAKKIFQQHERNIIVLEGGELLEDMDTPQAYQQLMLKDINHKSDS